MLGLRPVGTAPLGAGILDDVVVVTPPGRPVFTTGEGLPQGELRLIAHSPAGVLNTHELVDLGLNQPIGIGFVGGFIPSSSWIWK